MLRRWLARAASALACTLLAASVFAQWQPLAADGIHDPTAPGLARMQEPGDALRTLPRDSAGNMVRWVHALERNVINPRTNIRPETKVRVLDLDVVVAKYGSMPAVVFPHRQHTLWLDCTNCHNILFEARTGATRFSMETILKGEQCGLCHGAVAFPLTECRHCHSVPNQRVPEALKRQAEQLEAGKDLIAEFQQPSEPAPRKVPK